MLLRLIGGFCGASILALAAEGEPRTRAEALEQQQQQKQARLFPQGSDKAEQAYERVVGNPIVKRLLGNKTGFGIQFGTLYPGSGFSLGPDYTAPGLLNENLDLNVAAVGSLKQYYELRAGGSMRHLAQERVRFDFNVRRMDAPQVHYYGPGNNSDSHAKTNYRLEGMFAEGQLSVVPFRRVLQFGIVGGYSFLNVGPGKASDMPSSERVFSPAQAPGIDRQSDYFHVGPFLVVDRRDKPGDPHRGGRVGAEYVWNQNRSTGPYSFRHLQVFVEEYIPFFNEKRVLALRARTDLTYTRASQTVPFYMQPTLGGPNDLRGYSQFRFYDNNSMIFNAEYRRELATPLDLALFTDWGKVFPKPGAMAFSGLHGSGGVGLRFKTRSDVVMRIDVGFSEEGVRFWWAFSDIFRGFLHNLY